MTLFSHVLLGSRDTTAVSTLHKPQLLALLSVVTARSISLFGSFFWLEEYSLRYVKLPPAVKGSLSAISSNDRTRKSVMKANVGLMNDSAWPIKEILYPGPIGS